MKHWWETGAGDMKPAPVSPAPAPSRHAHRMRPSRKQPARTSRSRTSQNDVNLTPSLSPQGDAPARTPHQGEGLAKSPLQQQSDTPRQDTSQNDVNLAPSQPPQGDAAVRSPIQQQQDTPRHDTSLTDVNHRNPQTTTTNHRTTTPPIWQGRAARGESAAILGRNPDGTFQVLLDGHEKIFTEPNLAGMLDLRKGPLHAMLGQATQQQLAQPRNTTSTPPIWQGRAAHGENAAILGRNADGTFQVSLNGVEKTFQEPQVAAMTSLKKGPLYEMLGQATKGRLSGTPLRTPSADSSLSQTENGQLKEPLEARWKRKPLPAGADRVVAENWRQKLESKRVPNPLAASEVFAWVEGRSYQGLRHETERAAQSLLDMLPREMIQKVGKVNVQMVKEIPGRVLGSYDANTNTLNISFEGFQVLPRDLRPEIMRELMWHEMGHWLYHHADAHPRLTDWKQAIQSHWTERVQGQAVETSPEGWQFILDGWLSKYAGRLYRDWGGGAEIPSVYLEEVSRGPEMIAYHCRNKHQTETFNIVMSILGL